MFEIIFILIIVFLFILYTYYETNKANRGLLEMKQYMEDFKKAIEEFESFMDGAKYFNNKKYENWNKNYKYLSEKINFNFSKATIEKIFKEIVQKYLNYQNGARKIINEYTLVGSIVP